MDKFKSSKSWYLKRGIPYKRGYLFYGNPGNGKTSLVRALACEYKKDIYVLNLHDLNSDGELTSLMTDLNKNSILLIEDIDGFVKKRKVKGKKKLSGGVSFSAILNSLDGVANISGLVTIISTNKKEDLDSALIRPGRIDKQYEFKNPTEFEIKEYVSNWYWEEDLITDWIEKSDLSVSPKLKNLKLKDISWSSLQELCLSHSSTEFYNKFCEA